MAEQEETRADRGISEETQVNVGLSDTVQREHYETVQEKARKTLDHLVTNLTTKPIDSIVDEAMLNRNVALHKYILCLPEYGEYFKRMMPLYVDFNNVIAENLSYKKLIERVNREKGDLVNQLIQCAAKQDKANFRRQR